MPLGREGLRPSKAPNYCSLIGATINEGTNEAARGAGALILCGSSEWLQQFIQGKTLLDLCVIHLPNAEEIKHFFFFLCNSEFIGE